MMGADYKIVGEFKKYTGVKVPQFSFNRLANADNRLGVEMLSTGEVACFGENYKEAYLKALCATGFKIKNECNVLISIGSDSDRDELFDSIKRLSENNFTLYGTKGTTNYYSELGIDIKEMNLENINMNIKQGFFGLVINISVPDKIKTNTKTSGYFIRRLSIDYGIDILINLKNAKLYIDSIVSCYDKFRIIGDCDLKIS